MRLLDITEFYSPLGGGVRTYLAAKAQWIAARGDIEHSVIISSDRDGRETVGRTRVYHLRGLRVPGSPGYHLLLRRRRVAEIVAQERPDVIEIGSPFLAPWLARHARLPAPRSPLPAYRSPFLVGFFHSDERTVWLSHVLRRAPQALRDLADAFLTGYLRSVHRIYDATVVTSESARASLEEIGFSDTHLVPMGVDTETYAPERRDPAWRREVGAPQGAVVALYVGRLSTEKNLDVVVRALPELSARGVFVVLMGEGHQRDRLVALAAQHPQWRLRVLPFETDRERVARAYASADVFLAPCPYETFGLAAIEAMASGLPVVGANQGGISELLREAPGALTFDARRPAELVAAVSRLMLHVSRPSIRAWVVERYSWARTFSTLFALYARLLSTLP
jgi:alpha-1,6-mannosyltransferase